MTSTVNGVLWSAIERFSVQGTTFLISIIIARFITPSDYGLIAMVTIFIAISKAFIDSGFGNALIQKRDRTEIDFSTVFYFNLIIAAIIYTILFFCAPLISEFYNQPELTLIVRIIGLGLIFQGLSLVQRTKLIIEVNFRVQARISLVAALTSGIIGIIMACNGCGYWALVFQSLLNIVVETILLWSYRKWVPLFRFSLISFKSLFSFGSKLLMGGILQTIYLNLYSLIIGKYYNSQDVGFYNRASSIAQYPAVSITQIILRVVYPIQCKRQTDTIWINRSFRNYLKMLCFLVIPLMTLLCIIAKPLIIVILTEKWQECSNLIILLCLGYSLYPFMEYNWQILNVFGRSDLSFRAEVIKKVLAIIILFASLPLGLYGICIGTFIYNVFDVIIITHFSNRVINQPLIKQIQIILPIISISGISAFISCLWYFIALNNYAYLFLLISSFLVMFIFQCHLYNITEYHILVSKLKQIIFKKSL